MVYDRLGDRKAALSHLQEALRKSALDPYILSDLGRIYFLNGEFSKAQGVLNDAVWGSPDNYEAIFYLGRTELELGEYGKATTALESLIQKKPDYPQGHYFLSKAYERTGQKGDAHYHLGIFYNDKGDLRTALFHLKKAQEYLDDPFKLAKIKEMLDEIEGPRRGRRGIRKGFKDSRVQGFKGFYLNHSFRLNPRLLDPLNPQLTHFTRILESSNP
jgi:predicted Zn-dependent protease